MESSGSRIYRVWFGQARISSGGPVAPSGEAGERSAGAVWRARTSGSPEKVATGPAQRRRGSAADSGNPPKQREGASASRGQPSGTRGHHLPTESRRRHEIRPSPPARLAGGPRNRRGSPPETVPG